MKKNEIFTRAMLMSLGVILWIYGQMLLPLGGGLMAIGFIFMLNAVSK